MAAGCAVVATTIAASGTHSSSKNGLLIADTSSDMTRTIVALRGLVARLLMRKLQGWLTIRRPDDPGGLLRRKFIRDYEREQQGESS